MAFVTSLLVLTLVVVIHELGHYLAFKMCKVEILRFSVGFGPVIFRRWWKGTEWCLSAIPFGGYVIPADSAALRTFLREGDEERLRAERPSLFDASRWLENTSPPRKIIGSVAGPVANVFAAFLACFWIAATTELTPVPGDVTVTSVKIESIAAAAKLQVEDILRRVNGTPISIPLEGKVELLRVAMTDKEIELEVMRGGALCQLRSTPPPRGSSNDEVPDLGLTLAPEAWEPQSMSSALADAFSQTAFILSLTFDALKKVPTSEGVAQMSGPIGIIHAGTVGQGQSDGFLLRFFLVLNVGLFMFNLLPLPGLDGSHIGLAVLQWIRRRPLSSRVGKAYALTSALFIISLFLVLTVKDIWSLFS